MIKRKLRAAVRSRIKGVPVVYFIRHGDSDLVKVGLSRTPLSRLRALQTASPVPLHLLGLIPSTDANALERHLHGLWRGSSTQGEWYKLTNGQIVDGMASLGLRDSYIDVAEIEEDIRRQIEVERKEAERVARARPSNWTPENIRALRKRLGLTQKEFADKLGYARRETIADFEAGTYSPNTQAQVLLDMFESQVETQAPTND